MGLSWWPLVFASVENFVLINAVLCIAAFIGVAVARTGASIRSWHPLSLARLYAAALIVPPVAAAWLVSASLLPVVWLGAGRWAQEHREPHTLHLVNALTVPLDPLFGYLALAFVLIAAAVILYLAGSAYFRIGRVVRRLELGGEPAAPERLRQVEAACWQYGMEVGLVVSRYPFSFVWGYLRSKLIISTGLLNALTSEELSGLLEHEAAHHARRDNLLKWALMGCRYSSPAFPLTGLLYRWWNEQVEMICDEVAARHTKAPIEIAGALVRLKRLALAPMVRVSQPTASDFFGEEGEGFEWRVARILSLADEPGTGGTADLSCSWAGPVAAGIAGFVLSLVTLFLVSPLAIHRAVEAVLPRF